VAELDAMTVSDLIEAVAAALASGAILPSDVLFKNAVGNLAILRDDAYIGYVDLQTGTVDVWKS